MLLESSKIYCRLWTVDRKFWNPKFRSSVEFFKKSKIWVGVINAIECHIINGECGTYFGYIRHITPPGCFVCVFGDRGFWGWSGSRSFFNPISSNWIHFVRDFKNLATIRSWPLHRCFAAISHTQRISLKPFAISHREQPWSTSLSPWNVCGHLLLLGSTEGSLHKPRRAPWLWKLSTTADYQSTYIGSIVSKRVVRWSDRQQRQFEITRTQLWVQRSFFIT